MTSKYWVGVLSLLLGAATVVATVLGSLESLTWAFGLVDNFRFQFFWLALFSLAGLAWVRQWIPMGVVVVGILMNLAAIGPYWWGSITPPATADRFSMVSLNTQAANMDKAAVVDFVRRADADVIFLAEVTPRLLEFLERADLDYQRVTGTPAVTPIGLLALSRDPSISGRISNLGASGVPALIMEASIGSTRIEILAFHTSSPGRRTEARDDQLRGAGERVQEREVPMILIGDFNATPYTGSFRDLLGVGLIDAQRGRGVAGSWPSGWGPFKISIDHALHTPELTSTAFAFGDSAGSDHRSLAVTFAVAAAG